MITETAWRSRTWTATRTTSDDRSLVLAYMGSRTEYDATVRVEERDDEVVLTLLVQAPSPQRASGHYRSVRVALQQPLAGRRVVDGETGRQRVPFDGRRLRSLHAPGELVLHHEWPHPGIGHDSSERPTTWQQVWRTSREGRLTLSQGSRLPFPFAAEQGWRELATPVIVGQQAHLLGDEHGQTVLTWIDGTTGQHLALLANRDVDSVAIASNHLTWADDRSRAPAEESSAPRSGKQNGMDTQEPLESAMDTRSDAGTPGGATPDAQASQIAAGDDIVAAVQDDAPLPLADGKPEPDADTPEFREP